MTGAWSAGSPAAHPSSPGCLGVEAVSGWAWNKHQQSVLSGGGGGRMMEQKCSDWQ